MGEFKFNKGDKVYWSPRSLKMTNNENEERETDCKECTGWYNSCAPDNYPDYIDDPEHCKEFESRDIEYLLGDK